MSRKKYNLQFSVMDSNMIIMFDSCAVQDMSFHKFTVCKCEDLSKVYVSVNSYSSVSNKHRNSDKFYVTCTRRKKVRDIISFLQLWYSK